MTTFSKKIIITSSIFGLISLALFVFLIYPPFKDINKSSREYIYTKNDLASLEGKAVNFDSAKKSYDDQSQSLAKINKLFINEEVPLDFISFLENTGKTYSGSIEIDPGTIQASDKYGWMSLDFKISISDSYPNIIRFLKKIENSPALIEIQTVTLKKISETELKSEKYKKFSPNTILASITIKAFSKNETAAQ